MATDFTFINAALTRTGNDPITSLTDGTAQSAVANANYENMVKTALSENRWKFATKTETLSMHADEGTEPWLYAYELPVDVLILRNISIDGQIIKYALMFNKIMCDYDSSSTVVALYGWRPPESYWPWYFSEALTQRLEALFLRSLGERYEEAETRDGAAARSMATARRLDSQSQSPTDPYVYPILAARHA